MSFKVKHLIKNRVVHLIFNTQREMTRSLVRISEYEECPHFAGKIFTLKEYKKWYRNNTEISKGKFDYFSRVYGFNLPKHAFKPFFKFQFKNLTKREKKVLKEVEKLEKAGKVYYVMATFAGDTEDTVSHELAHALWSIDHKYRQRAYNHILKCDEHLGPIKRYLKSRGYSKESYDDEINAFVTHDLWHIEKEGFKVNEKVRILQDKLFRLYNSSLERNIKGEV